VYIVDVDQVYDGVERLKVDHAVGYRLGGNDNFEADRAAADGLNGAGVC
jgi:hypothetical protein